MAIKAAEQAVIDAGVNAVIVKIKNVSAFVDLKNVSWTNFINGSNYNSVDGLVNAVTAAINSTGQKCPAYTGKIGRACNAISANSNGWFGPVVTAGDEAAMAKAASVKATELGNVTAESTYLYSAIGYSVLVILIILLIMVIIYLILRYRRKKKMNKKVQYTKLLNQ
ncbi:hypothetical protein PFFCH_00001 [Plasmodium falciparum FCH/4]|uniref:Surface antigen n=1 Tax=Plasmodium falciparum FCH/4 TaxID=1036724 RepID=A0A024VW66_PLAFA|nr:hypothetical protein PFFCH_00001 [Plasmodium falciparum FCH/4]